MTAMPSGASTERPSAAIFPSRTKMEPPSIVPASATVRIVAVLDEDRALGAGLRDAVDSVRLEVGAGVFGSSFFSSFCLSGGLRLVLELAAVGDDVAHLRMLVAERAH
jgi:hypothetical protein